MKEGSKKVARLFCILKKFVYMAQNPVNIYLFKFNNRNTREKWEICSKATIKTSKRCQWCQQCRCQVSWMIQAVFRYTFLLLASFSLFSRDSDPCKTSQDIIKKQVIFENWPKVRFIFLNITCLLKRLEASFYKNKRLMKN